MAGLRILSPGPLATVQDLGRHGHQHLGFAPEGPVDRRSFLLAAALLRNRPDAPAIEITLGGFRARAEGAIAIALVAPDGARIAAGGREVPCNRTLCLADGDEIWVRRTGGARAYLAALGGFQVAQRLGSAATDLGARVGGTSGGPLTAGECLPLDPAARDCPGAHLVPAWIPRADREISVDCSPGPQFEIFSAQDRDAFGSEPYSVTPQADRVGMRLSGRALLSGPGQILSEGQPEGAVQVPPQGQPIVLLAGRRTIGGYPKVAVVSPRGLSLLGQALPGHVVRFRWREAGEIGEDARAFLSALLDPAQTVRDD